jgi:hypothetical protein
MFQTVFPSIIKSSRLYIQQQVYTMSDSYCYLLASGNKMELVHLVGFTIEIYYDAGL